MKFRWISARPEPLLVAQLAAALRLPPLLVQCLLNRGLREPNAIARFLQPRLRDLADPFRLPNMQAAVDRLYLARERKEKFVIFGDYDVDGVTSTALLLEVFEALGWSAVAYLPHRLEEGYGLTKDGVENCLARHAASLILAVDCGSASTDIIAGLARRGVDVIVLDHHQVASPAPPAVALVNPQLAAPAGTDFRELCSVGLAFKLAHALLKRGRETGLPGADAFDVKHTLDLVALGTIADLVPLIGENRLLVSAGLPRLSATARPGLRALKRVSQCSARIGPYEVGYLLGPRLNAAGRLQTAEDALQLLRATTDEEALPVAQALDARNRERQRIEKTMAEEVIGDLRARFDGSRDFALVEGRPAWHIGVVGIVATRVLQEFHRPTIIFGGDGEHWRGSGRSIEGFDLAAALRECHELLVRHGGHAMAVGATIKPDQMDAFRARLNEFARRRLETSQLQPALRLDAEVRLEDITLETLADLAQLDPVGQGNPVPHFFAHDLGHQRPLQRMGSERQHVKIWVTDGQTTHECVWWNAGHRSQPVGRFDLAFAPQINDYNGRRSVQLKVLDWRPTGEKVLV